MDLGASKSPSRRAKRKDAPLGTGSAPHRGSASKFRPSVQVPATKRRKIADADSEDAAESTPEVVSSNWQRLKAQIAPPPIPTGAPAVRTPWWVKKDAAKKDAKESAMREAEKAALVAQKAAARPAEAPKGGPAKRIRDVMDLSVAETGTTDIVALDCEMVGVGIDGQESVLAHVCIINEHGAVIYNERVQAVERVVDYRTQYSGIRPRDLKEHAGALPFAEVQQQVADIIQDRILVGHALANDLKALMLTHPRHLLRDTARYRPLQRAPKKPHALRYLAKTILGVTIQDDEHDPAEDARAALLLYKHLRKDWEQWIKRKGLKRKPITTRRAT